MLKLSRSGEGRKELEVCNAARLSNKACRKLWDAHHQMRRKAQADDVEAVDWRQHFAPGCSRVALMPLLGPITAAGLTHVTCLGAPLRS